MRNPEPMRWKRRCRRCRPDELAGSSTSSCGRRARQHLCVAKRIFKVVQDVPSTPASTDAIASDLGMVGSELGVPDGNVFGPVLKISRAHAGVTLGWGWQGKAAFLDQIEIEVDRGGGQGLVPSAIDTTPLTWTPKRSRHSWTKLAETERSTGLGDQRVGQWSAEIVGG